MKDTDWLIYEQGSADFRDAHAMQCLDFLVLSGGYGTCGRAGGMWMTIWKEADRRCTLTLTGAVIAVQLTDGERVLQERVVGSAEQALSLADVWAEVWKVNRDRTRLPRPKRHPQRHADRPRIGRQADVEA